MTIKHVQPASMVKMFFAIVLSLFSVYLFYEGTFFGLILLGVALNFSKRYGFELDLNGKRYRPIYSFFGIDIGFWKNLPEIEYISVFKTIQNTRTRVVTAETTYGFEVFKINLFHHTNQHIEVYVSDDKDDAFKVANHISLVLDLEVYDATE